MSLETQCTECTIAASIRTGQTEIVRRYGRYHTLTVVRWLSEEFSSLPARLLYKHDDRCRRSLGMGVSSNIQR